MPGSKIVTVRKAVVAGLTPLFAAYEGDEDRVEVSYQWQPKSSARARIFTRRGRYTTASAALRTGRNYRDETGRFEIAVLVEGVGLPPEDTAERALAIGLLVEEWIGDRKNNELGVTGLQNIVIDGDGELGEMYADSGTLAEITYPIRYVARIT